MHTTHGHGRYPLAEAELPRVHLEDDTLQQLRQDALRAIGRVLQDSTSWYYDFDARAVENYRPLAHKTAFTRAFAHHLPNSSHTQQVLTRTILPELSLEDAAFGLQCDSTAAYRSLLAHMYPENSVDGAILQHVEGATLGDSFQSITVKWIALRSSLSRSHRDYIYYEFCCTTRDADGRVVLVEYTKSLALDSTQLINDHRLDNVTRSSTYSLSTYRMDQDAQQLIHCSIAHCEIVGSSSLPFSITLSVAPVLLDRIAHLYELLDAKRVRHIGVTPDKLAPRRADKTTSWCRVCRKKFNVLRLKKWCRACGFTACGSCSTKLPMYQEGVHLGSRITTVRVLVCLSCLVFAREHGGPKPAFQLLSSMRVTNPSVGTKDSFFGVSGRGQSSVTLDSDESAAGVIHWSSRGLGSFESPLMPPVAEVRLPKTPPLQTAV